MEKRGRKRRWSLPPIVAATQDGSFTWERIKGIDYGLLGFFLSCHLIIEHYLDEYLRIRYSSLDWDAARHTFGQKVALLSRFKVSDKYDCIPAIKHLNSLRNKLAHDITSKIRGEDMLPLRKYLTTACSGEVSGTVIPDKPREILEMFTMMTCVLFAAQISTYDELGFRRKLKSKLGPSSGSDKIQ